MSPSDRAPARARGVGLRHEALLYATQREYLDATASFVRDGLDADEPVFVALPEPQRSLLAEALGPAASAVDLREMGTFGANPSRIIPAMAEFLHRADGQPVRAVGEPVWPARSPPELRECVRHEAFINLAFADAPLWWVCPYDLSDLGPDVIGEAWHTHPVVTTGEETRASPRYTDPLALAPLDEPLPVPSGTVTELPVTPASLVTLREALYRHAASAGLGRTRAEELVLAANEVATNALRYGPRPGEDRGLLRVWQDRGSLVCEVSGPGHIRDPLVGRRPPSTEPESGRGLWLVNQVCDLVELRSGATGTVVRMHVRL